MMEKMNTKSALTMITLPNAGIALRSASTINLRPSALLIVLNGLNALNALNAFNADKPAPPSITPDVVIYQSTHATQTITKSNWFQPSVK